MNEEFPFTAIVGMELAKRSMLYHAIDPQLGGTLLLGHRGCAKSTLARAFAKILPGLGEANPAPFVEVPLGTTEDRLLGSIDTSALLESGQWTPRMGLIQQAHQGILYIDEINLLPDHLTDSLLDSAASGRHRIERDGISASVEARYILIGSMNPEEGELRPQIVDRFAHGVVVTDEFTVEERMEIVQKRIEFDDDPRSFLKLHLPKLQELQQKIREARVQLKNVRIDKTFRQVVAEKARDLHLEGVRAELAVIRTARCSAAWKGRPEIESVDLEEAWMLCLGHRVTEPNAPPPPPPQKKMPPPPAPREPNSTLSNPSTAKAPDGAAPQSIRLQSMQPRLSESLADWWHHIGGETTDALLQGSGRTGNALDAVSRIAWVPSTIASIQQGWRPKESGWRLKFWQPTRRPITWVFLDASRSTGATRFLENVRNVLAALWQLAHHHQFYILLLKDNRPHWLLKRGTSRHFQHQMSQLNEASGKSYLTLSGKTLLREIQRRGVLPEDRLVLASDGLLSPEAGETAVQTRVRFRSILHRITRNNIPVLWLHPPAKRGWGHWLPKLTDRLPVHRLPVGRS